MYKTSSLIYLGIGDDVYKNIKLPSLFSNFYQTERQSREYAFAVDIGDCVRQIRKYLNQPQSAEIIKKIKIANHNLLNRIKIYNRYAKKPVTFADVLPQELIDKLEKEDIYD